MRLLLILLAVIFPLVLLTPSFWGLFGMLFSATALTVFEPDGTQRPALIGPKAPWPAWAIRPDGPQMTVRGWTGASATMAAHGQGNLGPAGDPMSVMADYRRHLSAAGWQVVTWLDRGVVPTMPPRIGATCTLVATDTRTERMIYAWLDVSHDSGGGIGWYDGRPPATASGKPSGAIDGGC